MDTKNQNEINELLNVDLDSIAAAGKKKTRETKRRIIRRTFLSIAVFGLVIIGVALIYQGVQRLVLNSTLEKKYLKATTLLDEGKYQEALILYKDLEDYKDSAIQAENAMEQIKTKQYLEAELLLENEKYFKAMAAFKELGGYQDSAERSETIWNTIQKKRSEFVCQDSISCNYGFILGVKADGTVMSAGDNLWGRCDVSSWDNIIAVSAGDNHSIGLTLNGTVVSAGENSYGQCDIGAWENIIAISAGSSHTVGLKNDGTVVAVGYSEYEQCSVSDWTDIVSIAAGDNHTIGLKRDGTVVAVGANYYEQCEVSDWQNIIAIAAGDESTVGLKNDGTVVAVGNYQIGNYAIANDLSGWTDIIAISVSNNVVGLKGNGTVIVSDSNSGPYEMLEWDNIVAISTGGGFITGLKSNGTLVSTGNNSNEQCDISDWRDIMVPLDYSKLTKER